MSEAQRVTLFCQRTLLPRCASWFTSQQQCEDAMRRTQTQLCEPKWVAETDCLTRTQASDWGCDGAGEPTILGTVCRSEYRLGSYCRVSVANPRCFVGACVYSTDCPSGMSCNDKTRGCFEGSAWCPGLPCRYSTDCPSNMTCNSALEQCVRK